jgi:hypothetical protein
LQINKIAELFPGVQSAPRYFHVDFPDAAHFFHWFPFGHLRSDGAGVDQIQFRFVGAVVASGFAKKHVLEERQTKALASGAPPRPRGSDRHRCGLFAFGFDGAGLAEWDSVRHDEFSFGV